MKITALKITPWILAAAAVAGLAWWALTPKPISVQVAAVSRAPLEGTVDADGITRVRAPWTVSATVAGVLDRPPVQEGDRVVAGETLVARLRPTASPFLDTRSRAQVEAAVAEAEAALELAQVQVTNAEGAASFAASQLARIRTLAEHGSVSAAALEAAQRDAETADRNLDAARTAARLSAATLTRVRAELQPPDGGTTDGSCCLDVKAPVSGVVLAVLEEDARPVPVGTPLVVLGDLRELGVEADVLSSDAVQVAVGAPAQIEGWGGSGVLEARVTRIDPMGRSEVSAMGVEEQRVTVHLDITSPPEARPGLGDRFQVRVRIRLWQEPSALQVPLGALFRNGADWAIFVIDPSGRAELAPVTVGRMTEGAAEILSGPPEGSTVVLFPPDDLGSGSRVVVEP